MDQSTTKTTERKEWGIPSPRQFAIAKYSKGKIRKPYKYFYILVLEFLLKLYFFSAGKSCELMFKKKCVSSSAPPPPVQFKDLKSNSALKIILAAHETDMTDLVVKSILSTLLDKVEEKLKLDIATQHIAKILKTFFSELDKEEVYHANYVPAPHLQNFFDKNVKKSFEEIVQLCCETVQQSMCKKWFIERKLRFTASSNVHDIYVRKTKTVDKLVKDILNPSNANTQATKYYH